MNLLDLYNFFKDATSPFTPVSSSCNTFTKSHWSAKLVLTLLAVLVPNFISTLPSAWLVLSGNFLEKSFSFSVGNFVFFANFKLAILVAAKPIPAGTKNPKPAAVKATVPVL